MKNVKLLITAGCSFSQVPNRDITWPVPLNKAIGGEVMYLGQGGAGNGIISRKVIYHVTEALKTHKPEELLVGIMWSGCERREIFTEEDIDSYKLYYGPNHESYSNPVRVASERNFHIMNPSWTNNEFTDNYFKHAHNMYDGLLNTLEHIVRTQWFLQLHNVPYFMTQFHYSCLDTIPWQKPWENTKVDSTKKHTISASKDLSFVFNQIDFNQWLPIDNCHDWCKHESGKDFARPPDPHPSTEQHEELVKRVILPFLVDKNMIYDIII